jgi:hypothetical protein
MSIENERRDGKGDWHLDKTFSISHLITTGLAILSLVTWLTTMEKRQAVLESEISHLTMSDLHLESQMREALTKIDNALERIENKLDQKQDKR